MKKSKIYRNDFLFSMPSFFKGMGSVLNIGGSYSDFNLPANPQKVDAKAIKSDWDIIGQDFRDVINEYESSLDNEKRE